METIKLSTQKRDLKMKAKNLRLNSKVPCVCYGPAEEPLALEADYQELRKTYQKAGTSSVIKLEIHGLKDELNVLIKDLQFNPISNKIEHVDFIRVNMNKPVYAVVPIKLIGKSKAVTDLGGVLEHQKSEVEIKCLPKYLMHEIEVDVSVIEDFHTSIHLRDLNLGEHVEIMDNLDDVIATVGMTRVEVEEPVAVEAAAPSAADVPASAQKSPEQKAEGKTEQKSK